MPATKPERLRPKAADRGGTARPTGRGGKLEGAGPRTRPVPRHVAATTPTPSHAAAPALPLPFFPLPPRQGVPPAGWPRFFEPEPGLVRVERRNGIIIYSLQPLLLLLLHVELHGVIGVGLRAISIMPARIRDSAREHSCRGPLSVASKAKIPERQIPAVASWTEPAADRERSSDGSHRLALPLRLGRFPVCDLLHTRGKDLRDMVIIAAVLVRDIGLVISETRLRPRPPPVLRSGPRLDVLVGAPLTGRPLAPAPGALERAASRLGPAGRL